MSVAESENKKKGRSTENDTEQSMTMNLKLIRSQDSRSSCGENPSKFCRPSAHLVHRAPQHAEGEVDGVPAVGVPREQEHVRLSAGLRVPAWVANMDLVELELRAYLNLRTHNSFEILKYHEQNNLEITNR